MQQLTGTVLSNQLSKKEIASTIKQLKEGAASDETKQAQVTKGKQSIHRCLQAWAQKSPVLVKQ